MKKFLLIDTFNLLHRAYHALPKTFTNEAGFPTNAIYGVTSMLINMFEVIKPDYIVAAMDSITPTFRVENFTAYKAHRKPMENELSVQIPKVKEVIAAFGIPQIEAPGYEADDVIGTIAKMYGEEMQVVIVSNDRDLWQLVTTNVLVMVPGKNGNVEWVGPDQVKAKMGFDPEHIIDYKALRGDPSDNIPGVAGIGDVTAKKLIIEYGSIENIYHNIANLAPKSLQEKLANNAEEAVMSKSLATVTVDAPVTFDLDSCRYREFSKPQVVDILKEYNFKSLIKRLGFEDVSKKEVLNSEQLPLL